MKYRIIRTDQIFNLIEKSTNYVVFKGTKQKVHQLKKHFENGGGFAGWTPQFIIQD